MNMYPSGETLTAQAMVWPESIAPHPLDEAIKSIAFDPTNMLLTLLMARQPERRFLADDVRWEIELGSR